MRSMLMRLPESTHARTAGQPSGAPRGGGGRGLRCHLPSLGRPRSVAIANAYPASSRGRSSSRGRGAAFTAWRPDGGKTAV